MIINLLLNVVVLFLGALFSWLPEITVLPQIGGFDIDAYLILGMGYIATIGEAFWFLPIIFTGFLFIMGYFVIKMVIRLFLGNRVG